MSPNRFNKNSAKPDDFLQQFFARIPPQTAATFNNAQLTALKQVFGERVTKRHAVDIRLSIPFFPRRFYLVLVLGKEKRSKERFSNQIYPPVNRIFLTLLGLVLIISLVGHFSLDGIILGIHKFSNQEIQIKK